MRPGLSKWKRIVGLVLVAYVVFILWKTLLCREPDPEYQLQLEPFWSWKALFDKNSPQLMQVLLNIVLFIPFGGLLCSVLKGGRRKRLLITIVAGFLLSGFIEISQLIFKLGLCEQDDVFDNTLGTALGVILLKVLRGKEMYAKFLKRFLDFILSFCALIVLSPILLLLIILGSVFMGGNPFFTQPRPGKDEKVFKLIKFRTMSNAKDKNGNLLPDEVRLNKYGRFLRSTSVDELPELLNILKGDMAVIGPRPQLVRDMVFMTDEQRKRHTVRPGLSGLAQVNGRNVITWEDKLAWDLKYIENITFIGDVSIILQTVGKVLKRADINREGTASDMDFGDYLLERGVVSKEEYDNKQAEARELMGV